MDDFGAVPAQDNRFVWLSGELDMWSTDAFAAAMRDAVAAGGAVVLDLSRLSFLDSDGIRSIISVARQLSGRGCLILHNPSAHVAKVLDVVGIDGLPDVHLIDARHGDRALPDGPGAWTRTAAFVHTLVDREFRMERVRATARRTAHLRRRTALLVDETRGLRATGRRRVPRST